MKYTEEEIIELTKTARTNGAIGLNATVPKIVLDIAEKYWKILDYGAGPNALHAYALCNKGFNVRTLDVNPNKPDIHIAEPYQLYWGFFDLVYVSNVLNIQPTENHVEETINDAANYLSKGGKILFNFATSPRKNNMKPKKIQNILENKFSTVERLKYSTPIWMCKNEM